VPASMRDVAALAGVSQRTVSNVVNNYVHVKPETRRKVLDAIEQLRYRPNILAQRLRQGRTGLVALAVPEIAAPYFAELADHIQRLAHKRGVTLLIDQTGGERERERLVLQGYRTHMIDGLILSPLSIEVQDLADPHLDFPIVLLGESIAGGPFLHVSVDNVAAARQATEHLIQTGRRRIAAIGAPRDNSPMGPAIRRLTGFAEAAEAAGVPSSLRYSPQAWTRREGYRIGKQIIEARADVDSVFCFNDLLALGAMKAFADLGVRVPADMAVVGWDDIEEAAYSSPGLTSIAPDKEEIARTAVDGILACLAGLPAGGGDVTAAHQLVTRESSVGASSDSCAPGPEKPGSRPPDQDDKQPGGGRAEADPGVSSTPP
jgi:DNA-binding LacI/PurR family transcriptional regulator